MGVLAKYHEDRKEALEWWKKMSKSKRMEAVSIWQEQLPDSSTVKNWEFQLIDLSSSNIELIYKFFKL